jgi:UDP-N-acetyl-D-mannosaminuronate dehydrogenase
MPLSPDTNVAVVAVVGLGYVGLRDFGLAVAHEAYRTVGAAGIRAFLKTDGVLFDVKSLLPRESVEGRL